MALGFFINVVHSKFENVKQMALKDLIVDPPDCWALGSYGYPACSNVASKDP